MFVENGYHNQMRKNEMLSDCLHSLFEDKMSTK